MTSKQGWPEAVRLIKEGSTFGVAAHIMPDGDAIGATLGLARILEMLGKKVHRLWGTADVYVPPHFRFLPGADQFRAACPAVDTFLALDCGSVERLGDLKGSFERTAHTLNIDHHRDNGRFGEVNVVEEQRSATSEMVLVLAEKLGVAIDREIAVCLYTGIVTDTGRFQYSNTTAETLDIAAKLIGHGVQPNAVFHEVYENQPFAVVKLFGRILARAQMVEDARIVYAVVTDDDLAETGTRVEDTENLIDELRATAGIEVAALFKEVDGSVRVSLRSAGRVDVGRLADERGGGGHPLAAGYTWETGLEGAKRDLFQAVKKQVKE